MVPTVSKQRPTRIVPVIYNWDGERRVMVPQTRFINVCNRQFEHGEEYLQAVVEERSQASHNQFFAAVHDGWMNLNEESSKHFPTDQHLRKWALVQTGYCVETDFVCDFKAEAMRLAAYIRKDHEYSVIKVSGSLVKVFDPESQSKAAMKKERFEQSKKDVLDLIATMARTTRPQLTKNAGRSA